MGGGSVRIEICERGIYNDEVRVGLDDRELFFELRGKHEVVVVKECDPIARSFSDSCIPGSSNALILLLDISDAITKGTRDLFCTIGRTIVHNNDLMRRVGLIQSAFEGFAEAPLRVIGRNSDADFCHDDDSAWSAC